MTPICQACGKEILRRKGDKGPQAHSRRRACGVKCALTIARRTMAAQAEQRRGMKLAPIPDEIVNAGNPIAGEWRDVASRLHRALARGYGLDSHTVRDLRAQASRLADLARQEVAA